MDICWHSNKWEQRCKTLKDCVRRHVRTWEKKWEPGILINNHKEVLVSVIRRKAAFEVDVDPLEWLSGFDKGNILWAMELRSAFTTYRQKVIERSFPMKPFFRSFATVRVRLQARRTEYFVHWECWLNCCEQGKTLAWRITTGFNHQISH